MLKQRGKFINDYTDDFTNQFQEMNWQNRGATGGTVPQWPATINSGCIVSSDFMNNVKGVSEG